MQGSGQLSEITRLREHIAQEYQAGQQGLTGLAQGTARHRFITARIEHSAEHLLALIGEGKHAEVQALMETPTWGLADEAGEGSAGQATIPFGRIDV